MAKLSDICRINMGQSPDSSSYNDKGQGIPFFQGNADFGEIHPKVRVWCNAPTKVANQNDILISVRAPIGALNIADEKCCIGRGLAALTVNADKCIQKYLWYALESKVDELNSKGTGSTFKAISKSVLFDTDIPVPSLNEQKKTSAIFDNITALIRARKQQLTKLDQLVKSRFIELFGDPLVNDKCYPSENGKSLFAFSSGKFLCEAKRKDDGIPVYGGNGIAWHTDDALIDFSTIIIGRVGAYCGNVKIVKEPVWITDNAIYIKEFKTNKFNLDFLYMLMTYLNFSQYADFSGQPKVTQKPLENVQYIIPPIDLQNQFAEFVEQTDKLKLEVKKSLEKLETLKKSLMQKYFG